MSEQSQRIDERAADYLAKSKNETDSERREREAWLAVDQRHLDAYRRLQELDARAAALLDDPELREAHRRDLEEMKRLRQHRRRWLWLAAVALVMMTLGYAIQKGALG